MRRPAACVFLLTLLASPALAAPINASIFPAEMGDPVIRRAQDDGLLPPGSVDDGQPQQDMQLIQGEGSVADLVARIQRIEAQNRALTGQVEEMQNLLRRSQEEFKRYREDTEFRLQALEGAGGGAAKPPARKPEAPAPTPKKTSSLEPQPLGTVPADPAPPMLDDSNAVQPAAPVAPRPKAPLSPTAPPGLNGVAVDTDTPPPTQPQVAAVPATPPAPQTPEDEYTTDYRLIETANYEAAELAFRKFISSYPKDRRVADATHWVGESLFQRKQYRDAAEQFLKVTTSYGSTKRAPQSMLRLGMSLAALGEKDAACATFQEVTRKYPSASTTVKSSVDRESKKNTCPVQ